MSEADQLDLESEDQDNPSTLAISRLTTSDDTETGEEITTRINKLEEIRKAVVLRNRLMKMHKSNKIVCNYIMSHWGCLKVFTSKNDSYLFSLLFII